MAEELTEIPGVGKAIAKHLQAIGIDSVAALQGQDPEDLYMRHSARIGRLEDRCLLYVFRQAVYYAEHDHHEPDKLLWWNWKDE